MRGTLALLVRRLVWSLVLVVGVASASFLLTRTLPGDPVRMLVGPQASPTEVTRMRALHGLDQPLATQYVRFWQRMVHRPAAGPEHRSCRTLGPLHVDLGTSYRSRKGVAELIAVRAPRSLQLALAAALLQLVLGGAIGTFAAWRRGTAADQLSIAATLLAVSAPTFVVGVGLQYLFAYRLGWLPLDGTQGDLRGLVLPAATLGLHGAALYARLVRRELARVLDSDLAKGARARGAGELRVLVHHAWPNALGTVLPLFLLDLGAWIGGAVVTEKVFRWPGLGALTVDAIVQRDAPVLFGAVMVSAAAVALATLALDALPAALDPRHRR